MIDYQIDCIQASEKQHHSLRNILPPLMSHQKILKCVTSLLEHLSHQMSSSVHFLRRIS
jgi:hypothetical protein